MKSSKQAVEYYIDRKRSEGDLAARAAKAAEEIERDAALRREALNALFGSQNPAADTPTGSGGRRRSREQSS